MILKVISFLWCSMLDVVKYIYSVFDVLLFSLNVVGKNLKL